MSSIGKLCIYCRKPIDGAERVALCDRCFATHHEECWERNGRCSTFRCAGIPRVMVGSDVLPIVNNYLEQANRGPESCPFCSNPVYAGKLTGKDPEEAKNVLNGAGLLFQAKPKAEERSGSLISKFRKAAKSNRKWFLLGGALKCRSCGHCRRLFLWGVPMDEAYIARLQEEADVRYCPHCSEELARGALITDAQRESGAKFECDETPNFHTDWFRHTFMDRYLLNTWQTPIKEIPAHSCETCLYTEIGGRPIYRVL